MRTLVPLVAVSLLASACGLGDAILFPRDSDGELVNDPDENPIFGEGEGEGEPVVDPPTPNGVPPVCNSPNAIFVEDFSVEPSQQMQGRTGTDCSMELPNAGCTSVATGPSPYQLFDLFAAEGAEVRVTAIWDGFDGYLALYDYGFDPTQSVLGSCIGANDDDGTLAASAMTVSLPAGEGRLLVASTFGGDLGGSFTLIMESGGP